MIYFTSDTHFKHNNIVQWRPTFKDIHVMDVTIRSNWNNTIKEDDDVYILGDLTMKGATAANEILSQLNGRKHLVKGNHDGWVEQQSFNKNLLVSVHDYLELEYADRKLILFHYPISHWKNREYGTIHLHGHLHSSPVYNVHNHINKVFKFDVGVDACNFVPISIEKILELSSGNPKIEPRHFD